MDYNAILSRLNLSRSKLESSEDMVNILLYSKIINYLLLLIIIIIYF